MQIGFVGLGRMGANMVERLLKGGHEVVIFNRTPEKMKPLEKMGAKGTSTIADLAKKLSKPKAIWLMVPAGEPVAQMIQEILNHISAGDIVIDGGNSHYKDSIRRAKELSQRGIHFLDVGTSGGIWGLEKGYCLMIGGEESIFKKLEPVFRTLAASEGYLYVGPGGSGHFVKMIHNGIEYGMLQAYGEGFEIMKASDFKLDFAEIARLWNQGSVVRSWLLELAEMAFKKSPDLASIAGFVEDSGEGRWTVAEAMEKNIPAPVIMHSLLARFHSRQKESFSAKFIAALRNEFGAHPVQKA